MIYNVIDTTVHCLFEQSGTFKKIFKEYGFNSLDYDICNQFGETDKIVDLFGEIETEYYNMLNVGIKKPIKTIFQDFKQGDIVLAFFPCTRFEAQIILSYRCDNYGCREWDDLKKLQYNESLITEMFEYYQHLNHLSILAIKYGWQLIIENPYTEQHFLTRYWSIKPKIIDMDRRKFGDYFQKPTQYWFINCEPNINMNFECLVCNESHLVNDFRSGSIERSLISRDYCEYFIKTYIL